MIENELDNGPQELPVESVKKNNTRTLVKRTLAIAGLALVVYFLYSIVHLFVSPDRNIQQIYLVPEDAAFIIQSSAPIDDWAKVQRKRNLAMPEAGESLRGRHPECGNARHCGPKQ